MRANAVHLTEDQMDKIGVHVIKGLGVKLDQSGRFIFNQKGKVEYRVKLIELAREVSPIIGFEINGYQVDRAVNWYARGATRWKTTIVVPSQVSVHEQQLKITITKLETEIATLNKKIEEQKELLKASYDKFKIMRELFK